MSDIIKDAYILFNKRKFSDVITLLEPQVFRFRENFNFFYLLGMSCLYQGDYGGSFSYLRRAVDLRENNVDTLLGIAAVYLKRGDTGNALRIWLDILEIEPGNIYAQKGLNYLKKNTEQDDFSDFASQDKILKFLPQTKKKKKSPFGFIISAAVLLITAAVIYFIFYREPIDFLNSVSIFNKKPARELPDVAIDERKDFINLDNQYPINFSESEVEELFRDIQDNLYDYRDNMAMHRINILLSSNASEYIKKRGELLSKYIEAPDLTNFRDNFDYAEVAEYPSLYNGCYILWKGRTVNLIETSEQISFDFLVGYHDEKILEGSVPVKFNFSIRILPNQPIELLGRIITVPDTGNFIIEGVSIKRL